MKQRTGAGLLLILAVFLFFRMEAMEAAGDPGGVRMKPPERGAAGDMYYYNEKINPFFPELAPYYKRAEGYVTGNCTWYAWGRACEIAGKKLPYVFTGSAGTWWEQNKREGWYEYGTESRRGAVVCYKTHVGVVERAKPLTVSESGWSLAEKKERILFNCGPPWRGEEDIIGYIYI